MAVPEPGRFCAKCAAWYGVLGMEPTPNLFVHHLVLIFEEAMRVLRNDGTCWIVIGDSYASQGGPEPEQTKWQGIGVHERMNDGRSRRPASGRKRKDLHLVPELLIAALRSSGWYARNNIIWYKPHAMTESVFDRCPRTHEYIFMLSKKAHYYYDQDAIKVMGKNGRMRAMRTVWEIPTRPFTTELCTVCKAVYDGAEFRRLPYETNEDPRRVRKQRICRCGKKDAWLSHFACVDEETECLTTDGWKRHDALVTGEIIAGFDMITGKARWTPLLDIAEYVVNDQEMVRIHGRAIDMLLTPNHRCVITRRNNSTLRWGNPDIVEASDLRVSHKIIVAPDWGSAGECPLHRDIVALIGWYVTEGSAGLDSIAFYQSRTHNEKYCKEITGLLASVGAEFTEHTYRRTWRGRDAVSTTWRVTGAVATELMSLCPDKRLPDGFLMWDNKSLEILWDSLMKGDGHFRGAGRQTFVQKNKAVIDQVQALATRLSFATTVRERSAKTWALYKTKQRNRLLRSATGSLFSTQNHTGIVWCPRTRYGTFIARRNGRVFVTGNTFPEDLVRPMILASTAAKCCPHCLAPWRRDRVVVGEFQRRWGTGNAQGSPYERMCSYQKEYATVGWMPGCECESNDGSGRSVVLDPFAGSGTTAVVAAELGRDYITIEPNADYNRIIQYRLEQVGKHPQQQDIQFNN
jgi:16S rRNA G966 N2-methylase RsmD